jgi:hypothetical protein
MSGMHGGARWWKAGRILIVAGFLAATGRAYHPVFGFTRFIQFQANGRERDLLPAVRAVPHAETPAGYDGQFYAQLALDPLLHDPAMDQALDAPQYRARRILFSWTAHILGFGKPAWILQVYAVQNVVTWLLFAWLMNRVIPQTSARAFALWLGCVCAHGLLASVWLALTDGPSLLLLVSAIVIFESGRPIAAALVLGLAGLARETSLLGASMFAAALRRQPRDWLVAGACLLICLAPLALWMDYLRSIYFTGVAAAGSDHITPPLTGLLWKMDDVHHDLVRDGLTVPLLRSLLTMAGLFVQAGVVIWAAVRGGWRSPWLLVSLAFLLVIILAKPAVWDGSPGAFTRVALPMTVGVNVLLARQARAPWWVIGGANLSVIPGMLGMVF